MSKGFPHKYTGKYTDPHNENAADGLGPYIPSDALTAAVNLAIALERPLLLEGEPGSGKTRLAMAVAREFTLLEEARQAQEPDQTKRHWPYYTWTVKSTSRVQDGLYHYDAVGRLRDTQIIGADPDKLQGFLDDDSPDVAELQKTLKTTLNRLLDPKQYREFGPLGQALQPQHSHPIRPIVLIDEIDKADIDFPNDLLLELENYCFEIPETGETIGPPQSGQKPIIFITSNREKPLPAAFLRRCIYFYVDFPDQEQLEKIIQGRFKYSKRQKPRVKQAVETFRTMRQALQEQLDSKPPSTSELLDYLGILLGQKGTQTEAQQRALLGALLKTKEDQDYWSQHRPDNEDIDG